MHYDWGEENWVGIFYRANTIARAWHGGIKTRRNFTLFEEICAMQWKTPPQDLLLRTDMW